MRAKKVILSYVTSYENNADVFTKPFSRICFEQMCEKAFWISLICHATEDDVTIYLYINVLYDYKFLYVL